MALGMEQYFSPRSANTYGPAGLILTALGGLILMALDTFQAGMEICVVLWRPTGVKSFVSLTTK
jgi:hypothetical protein